MTEPRLAVFWLDRDCWGISQNMHGNWRRYIHVCDTWARYWGSLLLHTPAINDRAEHYGSKSASCPPYPQNLDTNVDREMSLRTDNYAQILMRGLNTTTHLLTMIRSLGGKHQIFLTLLRQFLTIISIVTLYH